MYNSINIRHYIIKENNDVLKIKVILNPYNSEDLTVFFNVIEKKVFLDINFNNHNKKLCMLRKEIILPKTCSSIKYVRDIDYIIILAYKSSCF